MEKTVLVSNSAYNNGKSGTEYNQVLIDITYGTWVKKVE
jgi:hypothetical protein